MHKSLTYPLGLFSFLALTSSIMTLAGGNLFTPIKQTKKGHLTLGVGASIVGKGALLLMFSSSTWLLKSSGNMLPLQR